MGKTMARLRWPLAALIIAPIVGMLPPGGAVEARSTGRMALMPTPGSYSIFGLSQPTLVPEAITSGPDGALWVAVIGDNGARTLGSIARVSTGGAITYFSDLGGLKGHALSSITTGPDGNIWSFYGAANYAQSLISMSQTGVSHIVAFPLAKHFIGATYVTRGASGDKHLYYDYDVQFETPRIAQITTTGHLSALVALADQHQAGPFTPGPDGNVWFADEPINGSKERAFGGVGYITPTGAVHEYNLFQNPYGVYGITTGPDRNIWLTGHGIQFQKQGYNYPVARITPAGKVTVFDDPFGGAVGAITSGADGNLYLVNNGYPEIERVTPNGAFTRFASPVGLFPAGLTSIALGSDHNLWATDTALGPHPSRYIVRLTAPARFSVTPLQAKVLVNVPAPLVALARFTDASPGATPSAYSGTVNWGVGSSGLPLTPLTVTGGNGSFTISSQGHLYPGQPGNCGGGGTTIPFTCPVTVTMKSTIDGGITIINTTARVRIP